MSVGRPIGEKVPLEEPAVNGSSSGEVQAPSATKFNATREGRAILAEVPMAVSISGELLVYLAGAYRPRGEVWLRRRVTERRGEDWKRSQADEVLAYVRAVAPHLADADPDLRVNCRNGLLDLDTGLLTPHDPAHLSQAQIAAAYDPKASCPQIERFIGEVLGAEVAQVYFEIVGYLLTPGQWLQRAFMFLGEGSNGKSKALALVVAFLGAGNVSAIPLHHLDENRFAVAELQGKLANVFPDLDSRALQASSMFKSITGEDGITGERKHRDPFTFRPGAKLLFSANEPPPTPDSTDAFFRRWVALPFEKTFKGRDADPRILDRLTTPQELSGLLNRGIAALPGLRERRAFTETEATTRAASRFRVDADSVAGFFNETCRLDPDGRVVKAELFPAYLKWCQESNRKPYGKQKFNRRVEATAGIWKTIINGRDHWAGVEFGEPS